MNKMALIRIAAPPAAPSPKFEEEEVDLVLVEVAVAPVVKLALDDPRRTSKPV
jgi:hypothetical protein